MPILNICPKRLSLAVTVVILLIRISKSIRLRLYSIRRSIWEEGNITEKGFEYDLLSVCTRAHRPDGTLLFREKLVAEPFLNPVRAIGTMHDYDVFANVVVLTPPQETSRIYEQTKAYIDRQEDIAVGISHLPNDCGLIFKVLGKETSPVKKVVRQFCSTVRMQVKGKPLPEEFAWR